MASPATTANMAAFPGICGLNSPTDWSATATRPIAVNEVKMAPHQHPAGKVVFIDEWSERRAAL